MACRIDCSDFQDIARGSVGENHIDLLRSRGWDVLPSGLTLQFRKDWNLWHSFREFVQNALDETGEVDITVDRCGDSPLTLIRDNGRGFAVQALLLGEQKGQDERQKHCLRGRFGEGMKLGVLPVLRAGGRVLIRTVGVDATWQDGVLPMAGQKLRGVLTMTRPNTNRDGTCIAIDGLDAEHYQIPGTDRPQDLRLRVAPVLTVHSPDKVLHSVRGGPGTHDECKVRQLLDLPGAIYVRDIFVGNNPAALAGYNLWFDDAASALDPNRDRLTLEPWSDNLAREIRLLLASMPVPTLERFIRLFYVDNPDMEKREARDRRERSFEWSALDRDGEPRPGFFQDVFVILSTLAGTSNFSFGDTDAERKTLDHAGVLNMNGRVPHELLNNLAHVGLVKSVQVIQREVGSPDHTLHLSPKLVQAFLSAAAPDATQASRAMRTYQAATRRLTELSDLLMRPERWASGAAVIPLFFYVGTAAGEERRVLGFTHLEGSKSSIHLSLKGFETGDILETLVHEAAHAVSQASDQSDRFEDGLARVGVRLAGVANTRKAWYVSLLASLEGMRELLAFHPATGKFAVNRDVVERHSLPGALVKHGEVFFGTKKPPAAHVAGTPMSGRRSLSGLALSGWGRAR